MLASIFQNSKSALAFAASVIVCALMLVGPKESGGVLDKAVSTYKDERANVVSNAAAMSEQMSTPQIGDYKPPVSGLEEPADGLMPTSTTATDTSRVIRLDPVTMQPIGVVPPPPPAPGSGQSLETGYAAPSGDPALQTEPAAASAPRGEAVVTSRMIRIQPQ